MITNPSAPEDEQIVVLRMVVACDYNSMGEPDLYFCKVRCRRAEYKEGEHYVLAQRKAEDEGYGGKMIATDEHDPMGRNLLDKFEWDTASTWTV